MNKKLKKALDALKKERPIILTDDEDRENEGDLIFPAESITPEKVAFMLKYCSGIICLAMTKQQADKLQLSPMVKTEENSSRFSTPFTISIEAKQGVTTGVSANDRCQTIRTAVNPTSKAEDLARPGHVFPLIANTHGVLARQGHTEGSVDLMKLAGLPPQAVLCELTNEDGSMMKGKQLDSFSQKNDVPIISIDNIYQHRINNEIIFKKTAESTLYLRPHAKLTLTILTHKITQEELVILHKEIDKNPLVRIHSSCFTGDVLGSLHCDCQSQLHQSLEKINQQGGLLIYLNQEGRGIGLANKIKAYALQQEGLDTVEANLKLGFSADERQYDIAAHALKYFNIQQCRLLTNNPKKIDALEKYQIKVKRETIETKTNHHNQNYLKTKSEKLGHLLSKEIFHETEDCNHC